MAELLPPRSKWQIDLRGWSQYRNDQRFTCNAYVSEYVYVHYDHPVYTIKPCLSSFFGRLP